MRTEYSAIPAPTRRLTLQSFRRERHLQTGSPVLLVASAGGHLEELLRISRRFPAANGTVEWVTPHNAHSNSLLQGQVVHTVPYVGPRDYGFVASQFRSAHQLLSTRRYAAVVSTGAAIAVPYLAVARMRGIPAHYIESAARSTGPSLSGKVVSRIPGVALYTQYDQWPDRRWSFQGSVFDGFTVTPDPEPRPCRRVVVVLGTMQKYGFRRAVLAVQRVLAQLPEPPQSVLWQTGCTDLNGLGIQGHQSISSETLSAAILAADLVITHAGVGSALTALGLGRCPVLLPRLARYGEHVDDHQLMIARFLQRRGLAVVRQPDELTLADIQYAAQCSARQDTGQQSFTLIH